MVDWVRPLVLLSPWVSFVPQGQGPETQGEEVASTPYRQRQRNQVEKHQRLHLGLCSVGAKRTKTTQNWSERVTRNNGSLLFRCALLNTTPVAATFRGKTKPETLLRDLEQEIYVETFQLLVPTLPLSELEVEEETSRSPGPQVSGWQAERERDR